MAYSIGVDIGGTNIAAAVLDKQFNIVDKASVKTGKERPYERVIEDIAALVNALTGKFGKENITDVGLGCPGTCDVDNGILVYSNNLNWHNVNLKGDTERLTGLPAYIENDANAAAYGEFVRGAAKSANSAVVITLGTGVGSGIITEGKLLHGMNYAGGEIGHTVIEVNGPLCTCGRRGCFEAFSSATGLIRMTEEAIVKHPDSLMAQATEEGKVSARTAFTAAKQGDKAALAVVQSYIEYLAAGITNTINTFQPDMLCIGGGVCGEGDYLLIPLRKLVAEQVYSASHLRQTEIVVCQLGNDAGIIGAAALAVHNKG
jgi:glucokinase